MDIYRVLVLMQDGKSLGFHFKSIQAATEFAATMRPSLEPVIQTAADDYGNTAQLNAANIVGNVRTYIPEDLNAQTEVGFLQAHSQVKAQRRAATDPMLKGIAVPMNGVPQGMQ